MSATYVSPAYDDPWDLAAARAEVRRAFPHWGREGCTCSSCPVSRAYRLVRQYDPAFIEVLA